MNKDKASQKTEDEVINETFGGFDENMTEQTMDQTGEQSASPFEKKKTGSSNTILFAGAGIAAVAVLGWMFIIKPAMAPNNQQAMQQDPTVMASNTAPAVPVVPVAIVAPPIESPESKAATQFLSGQTNSSNPANVSPASNPVSVTVTPPTAALPSTTTTVTTNSSSLQVTTPVASATPVVKTTVETKLPEIAVTKNNATSAAVVNELSSLFETQSKQFKVVLDDVGNKIQSLDTFKGEQKVINKNVEERLVKLEEISGEKKSTATNEKSSVKKATPRLSVNKVSKPVKQMRNDSNVLVDKTDALVVEKKSVTKEVETMTEFNIHSIYGNRVWLKNADGSLSTYSSGEKLPSGELIKSIDDEKFSVTTDKRKFSKR